MTKLGLMKAAELTGKSASTIHRAMKAGRLSFEMNDHGERTVDALELEKMEVELRAERAKNALLEQLLDEMRQERQAERREKERLLSILEKHTLLLPKPQEDTPPKKI